MKDITLLKLAFVLSLIGTVILYFINLLGNELELRDIHENIGNYVKIKGKVKEVKVINNTAFLEVLEPHTVRVVVFNLNGLNLNKGDEIEVIGRVEMYKGLAEVIAYRIRVIK